MDEIADANERGWTGTAAEDGGGLVFMRTLRSVPERYEIDGNLIRSAEARRLDAMTADLQAVYARPAMLGLKEVAVTIRGPVALVDTIMAQGRKGIEVQRYKGLGEMNPDQLWDTTLDPDVRTLLQVRVNHVDESEEVFSTLMGDVVEPRREFIQSNALAVENLDV